MLLVLIDCLVPRDEKKIYDSVIRLHVLANSDSTTDQEVKLQVRDAIIAESAPLFEELPMDKLPLDQMEAVGEQMRVIADRVLEDNGFSYRSAAVWGKETYPTREYDGVRFPAGEYYSLRITLGEAEGQNWWCVLFPPLCTNAAKAEENLESMGMTEDGIKVYTKRRYVFRFKLLEFFNGE